MKNFPKLESPFIREESKKGYLVQKEINTGFEWLTDKGVMAVDKLDGTNVGITVKDGNITRIFNRTNEKFIWNIHQTKWEGACMEGLAKSIQRGWLGELGDGEHYGELIGEIFNGNRHQLQGHLFVSFKYLLKNCFWKSWASNKYPKDFDTISEWFKDLPSLFNQRMKLPDIQAEGLIFYHPDGRMCKLRRDMFEWYKQ